MFQVRPLYSNALHAFSFYCCFTGEYFSLKWSWTRLTPLMMTTFPAREACRSSRNTVRTHGHHPLFPCVIHVITKPGVCAAAVESEYRPLLPYSESTSEILLSSLNPVDNRKWRRKPWTWKVVKVVKVCTNLANRATGRTQIKSGVVMCRSCRPAVRLHWRCCSCSAYLWWTRIKKTETGRDRSTPSIWSLLLCCVFSSSSLEHVSTFYHN